MTKQFISIGAHKIRNGKTCLVTELVDFDKDYPLRGDILNEFGEFHRAGMWTLDGRYNTQEETELDIVC